MGKKGEQSVLGREIKTFFQIFSRFWSGFGAVEP